MTLAKKCLLDFCDTTCSQETWGVFLERISLIMAPPQMPQLVAILPKAWHGTVFVVTALKGLYIVSHELKIFTDCRY